MRNRDLVRAPITEVGSGSSRLGPGPEEGGLFIGVAGDTGCAADSTVEGSRGRGKCVRSLGNFERDVSLPLAVRPRPSLYEDMGAAIRGFWSSVRKEKKTKVVVLILLEDGCGVERLSIVGVVGASVLSSCSW